jgi:hypothetical protein
MGCGDSKEEQKQEEKKGQKFELPQKCTKEMQDLRKIQLDQYKEIYQFEYSDWMPPHFKGIPKKELDCEEIGRVVEIFRTLDTNRAKMGFNIGVDALHDIFKPDTDPFQDYLDMLPGEMTFNGYKRPVPKVAKTWRTDEEFARQRIIGFNPFVIKKYKEHVAKFPISTELLHSRGALPAEHTLEALMQAGRLYWCDYPHLVGCPLKPGMEKFWTAPIALFWVNDSDDLMPLAIQLQQDPATAPIITNKDNAWLAAKIFTQLADVGTHELYWHLTSCHLIPEFVYVSAKRQLAETHPICELLTEHFWFTLAVNYAARDVLVSNDGEVPTMFPIGNEGTHHLVRTTRGGFNWNLYNPHFNVDQRECGNLPKYYFRDDAYELWDIVTRYIHNFVNSIYQTEEDLKGDYELSAWSKEVLEVGKFAGMPIQPDGTFASKKDLEYFLSTLIFNVTAMHAATNNGQFDHMGFVPNTPATFMLEPPTSADQSYTDADLARAMPKTKIAILQVGLMATLSTPAQEGQKIGQYDPDFMKGRKVTLDCVGPFQQDLKALSQKIKARNANLAHPYVYLDPDQMANGVDI